MMNFRILTILLLTVFQCFEISGKQDLLTLFPADSSQQNWKIIDSIKVFNGDELFNYMDGGAEVYIEYGFERIAVAQYLVDGKEQIQGEIYQMKDAAGAYGNFTFYITDGMKKIEIATDGAYNDYYLTFWKGSFLIVISSPIPTDSTLNRMKYLAMKIARNIDVSEDRPKIVEKFLKAGYDISTIKFFKGRYGLINFFRFTPNNAFDFGSSIAVVKDSMKIIVHEYDNKEKAQLALHEAYTKITKVASNQNMENLEGGFQYVGPGNIAIKCIVFNQYIIVAIDKTQVESALFINLEKILE